jgi:S-adenosyl-L-methionine hydrolase (adenosine-forming)
MNPMIVLITDFGVSGPYVGQMHAVLARQAPGVPIIDLFNDLPRHNVRAAAYLLPAYTRGFPPDTAFVCVVDPGVGGSRRAVVLRADYCWYIGPDNGLLHMLERRARKTECHEIVWRPPRLSASFHGRDLFAPVAAMLARGQRPEATPAVLTVPSPPWPDDLAEVLYVDHFGNCITGLRASEVARGARLRAGRGELAYARTYSEVEPGQAFWYENANGLVELAASQTRADTVLEIAAGDVLSLIL